MVVISGVYSYASNELENDSGGEIARGGRD